MTAISPILLKRGCDLGLVCQMEPNQRGRFFDAASRVCAKAHAFFRVEGDDCLDKPDGPDGQKVFGFFFAGLVLFYDMGYEAQISFDQYMLCLQVTLCISLHIFSFFRRCEGLGK